MSKTSGEDSPHSDLYTYLHGLQVPVINNFFRAGNENAATIINEVAPIVVQHAGPEETFNVVEIGCSQGKETWSMAAGFAARGIRFSIEAIDVNDVLLELATLPYHGSKEELAPFIERWGLPRSCLNYFEQPATNRLQPAAILRQYVTFRQLDVSQTSLGPRRFHAAVANHVLGRYQSNASHFVSAKHFERMVGNIAAGLLPNGILAINDVAKLPDRLLKRHHLELTTDFTNDRVTGSFHQYVPPQPTKRRWFSLKKPLPAAASPPSPTSAAEECSIGQVGAEITAAIDALPFASLQTAITQVGEAREMVDSLRSDAGHTLGSEVTAASEHLQNASDHLHLAVESLHRYLEIIGVR